MKTKYLISVLVAAILVFSVTATIAINVPANEKAEKSPAIDVDGDVIAPPEFVADLPESKLTKIIFIRYAPGKEPACNSNDICEPRENWKNCPSDCKKGEEEPPATACYDFLTGSKPRWNWVENYYYSTSTLDSNSSWATGVWNNATSATIFGNGFSGAGSWGDYDYMNSIVFGNYNDPNVIAVTAIWFRGKNIYEYDILFDTDYFPGSVDLDTVALHEFGHGAGLNDLYNSVCSTEVMYGIYDGIDLDLGSGDIAGIQKLYGI